MRSLNQRSARISHWLHSQPKATLEELDECELDEDELNEEGLIGRHHPKLRLKFRRTQIPHIKQHQ